MNIGNSNQTDFKLRVHLIQAAFDRPLLSLRCFQRCLCPQYTQVTVNDPQNKTLLCLVKLQGWLLQIALFPVGR